MEYKKQKETTLESYYDWFALLPYYKTEDKSFVAIIDKSNTENIALAKTLETVSFAIAEYAKQTEKKLIPKNYIEWLEILSFLEKKNKGNAEEPKCDFSWLALDLNKLDLHKVNIEKIVYVDIENPVVSLLDILDSTSLDDLGLEEEKFYPAPTSFYQADIFAGSTSFEEKCRILSNNSPYFHNPNSNKCDKYPLLYCSYYWIDYFFIR